MDQTPMEAQQALAVDFITLRDLLELLDGNLGAHSQKLEESGYIEINQEFVENKPRSFISATQLGRGVCQEHVEALEAILKSSEG